MSRAFVKEPDGDDVAVERPARRDSGLPNYVTPAGERALRARLAALEEEHRAVEAGDERLDRKSELARIAAERDFLRGRLEAAIVVPPPPPPWVRVTLGALVTVRVDGGDDAEVFNVVGEDEIDAACGRVSWCSPLGRALMGAEVGDVVTWRRPLGDAEVEIEAITHDLPPGGDR